MLSSLSESSLSTLDVRLLEVFFLTFLPVEPPTAPDELEAAAAADLEVVLGVVVREEDVVGALLSSSSASKPAEAAAELREL